MYQRKDLMFFWSLFMLTLNSVESYNYYYYYLTVYRTYYYYFRASSYLNYDTYNSHDTYYTYNSQSSSAGPIAGGVIGGLLVVGGIIACCLFFRYRSRRETSGTIIPTVSGTTEHEAGYAVIKEAVSFAQKPQPYEAGSDTDCWDKME